ncbi:MAG: type II toxin-antitoxin system YhaV family toxin [Chloroflexi bacterium]|nr:type II toxin-antitoxin system YhaV family toxin [Chloroflexota bacterium]
MFTANGWRVYFHRVFADRYRTLIARVTELCEELPPEEHRQHRTVKLLAQVTRLIRETIPANPDAPEFRLKQDLGKFRRAKGYGLPPRYRLFFVFSSRLRVIIFLYLNDDTTLPPSSYAFLRAPTSTVVKACSKAARVASMSASLSARER